MGRVRFGTLWARHQGKLDKDAGFNNVQAILVRPLCGDGTLGAWLEPDGLRASGLRLRHDDRRLRGRHNHIDSRGRFWQFEQTAVGGIALYQALAIVDRIDCVAGFLKFQVDPITIFGPVVAGPHYGPNGFVYVFFYEAYLILHVCPCQNTASILPSGQSEAHVNLLTDRVYFRPNDCVKVQECLFVRLAGCSGSKLPRVSTGKQSDSGLHCSVVGYTL